MKTLFRILVTVLCLFLFATAGCDSLLAGIGIGAASSETLQSWEENLEAKRVELDRLYDEAITGMQDASDPNELAFYRQKANEVQLAQVANLGARTLLGELKSQGGQGQGGYLNLLHAVIPLALTWGGNELRKRVGVERKRQAEKQGRELALRELAEMDEKDITAPVVKKLMYKDIGDALKG